MALIRAKLRELRDADVRFISLVDRAATRIPFRVLKRDDKETEMGIDLMNVSFKRENQSVPQVLDVAVVTQKNDDLTAAVRKAIEEAGFKTDLVRKAEGDEGAVVYGQGDLTGKEPVLVRLSDQVIVAVDGLAAPTGPFMDVINERGFYPGVEAALDLVTDTVLEAVAKGDLTPVVPLLAGLTEYMQILISLPPAVFKMDAAVCACHKGKDDETPAETTTETPAAESADDKKKPAMKTDDKPKESAQPTTDLQPLLEALAAVKTEMAASITALTTKVDGIAQEQTTQKTVLEGVVTKADTLSTTLASTVVAPVTPADRTTGDRVVKADDDPRTGNFDTAFLRKRRR